MPLNRLEKILGRHGMEIPKSTMARAIGSVAALLEPIVEIVRTDLLASGLVHIDDTPVQVLDESKSGESHRGYFWAFCNKEAAVIRFTKSRSHEEPAKWLSGFQGYLVADAFGVNQCLGASNGTTLCGCLAHVRRKFFELKDSQPWAAEMVARIGKLYEVEKQAKEGGLSPPQHLELRQKKSAQVFEGLRSFILEKGGRVLPKSSLGQAFFYAKERLPTLVHFLVDSAVPLDNNLAERCLRHEVIGRKNWMFAGSFDGALSAATIFSLVMTCNLQGVDPWAYLKDTLSRVAGHSIHRLAELTPQAFKLRSIPARSDNHAAALRQGWAVERLQLMKVVLGAVLAEAGTLGRLPQGTLSAFKDVLMTDSTVIRLHDFLKAKWPACRTNHTQAALKAHVILSVQGCGPSSVRVTSERVHDGFSKRIWSGVRKPYPGSLWISWKNL